MINKKNFGYWVFGRDMLTVNLESLKENGVTDLFLNYYAFTTHGETRVREWVNQAKVYGLNVHIWMQCFYDGDWHNPVEMDLTSKVNEAKKYANIPNVHGVHLDYLRYPGNAYKTGGGANAITNFVKRVRNELPEDTFLSCAVMPESETKYYYGQDIEALGGIVDVVVPMQYKGNYHKSTDWLASTSKSFGSKANIWSGLQAYKSDDDTSLLSSSELEGDVQTCLNNSAKGVLLFRYGLSPNINFKKYQNNKDEEHILMVDDAEVQKIIDDIRKYVDESIAKIEAYYQEKEKKENTSNTATTTVNSNVTVASSNNVGKSISNTNIYNMASDIKKHVENGGTGLPNTLKYGDTTYTWADMMYIMPYGVKNLSSDCNIPVLIKPSDAWKGDSINEQIQKDDFLKQAENIINYISKNNNLIPNYVTTINSKKMVNANLYTYCMAKILVYYKNHDNTLPNTCSYNSNDVKQVAQKTETNTTTAQTTTTTTNNNTSTESKKETVKTKHISNANIFKMASEFKSYVENNQKVPYRYVYDNNEFFTKDMTWIFLYALYHLKSDMDVPVNIQWCDNASGDNIVENIYTDDYKKQALNVHNYILSNNYKVPNYVTTINSKKKVNIDLFTYCMAKILVYYKNNGELPNYCSYDYKVFTKQASTSSSSSGGLHSYLTSQGCSGMGQCTGYYCACNSLQQAFYRLTGVQVAESKIAGWAGTTSSGTGHSGIESAVAQFNKVYGKNVKITWKNFSDLGSSESARWSALQSYINKGAVFCHLLYRDQWGHYEVPKQVNSSNLSILNSLGDSCGSGTYCGYIETRSKSAQLSYINGISQKSIAILTNG